MPNFLIVPQILTRKAALVLQRVFEEKQLPQLDDSARSLKMLLLLVLFRAERSAGFGVSICFCYKCSRAQTSDDSFA